VARAWAERPFDALANPPLTMELTGEEVQALRRLLVEEKWPHDCVRQEWKHLNNIYVAIYDACASTLPAGQLDDGFFGGDATGYDDGYAGEALL